MILLDGTIVYYKIKFIMKDNFRRCYVFSPPIIFSSILLLEKVKNVYLINRSIHRNVSEALKRF